MFCYLSAFLFCFQWLREYEDELATVAAFFENVASCASLHNLYSVRWLSKVRQVVLCRVHWVAVQLINSKTIRTPFAFRATAQIVQNLQEARLTERYRKRYSSLLVFYYTLWRNRIIYILIYSYLNAQQWNYLSKHKNQAFRKTLKCHDSICVLFYRPGIMGLINSFLFDGKLKLQTDC